MNPILPVYKRCDYAFTSGKGCFLKDSKGKKYLDLGAGIAVNSLGYSYPKLVKTLKKAAEKPWHISNLYEISGQQDLAEKLVQNSSCDQVFFCNSGTEAIETAIKIIRKYFNSKEKSKKKKILTFEHAFHGRTLAAISASGNKQYQEGYEPLSPGFINVPLKNATKDKISKYITDDIAAILIEPIQGEGGVNVFTKNFLKELEKICRTKKILLVVDEVQCGVGRTGKFFHYQWSDIKPDIITVAKGIGGGFPLGACLVKESVGKVMTYGSHGGTYGGNPLAMNVGNTVIDEILKKGFLENIVAKGKYFKEELKKLQNKYPQIVKTIKGEGLMLGVEIVTDHIKIVESLRKEGVLTIPASNKVVRIIPPLIITKKEINLAIKTIDKILSLEQ